MKYIFILIFTLLPMTGFCGSNIILEIRPSFMDNSLLWIQQVNKGYSISFYSDLVSETSFLPDSCASILDKFLKEYPTRKQSLDSIENVKILENAKNGYHRVILDGIHVVGIFTNINWGFPFKFSSPQNESIDYQLMKILYGFISENFHKQEVLDYSNKFWNSYFIKK